MNIFGLSQSVHTWIQRAAFLISVTSGIYFNIFSIVFGVSVRYMYRYNKQVIVHF